MFLSQKFVVMLSAGHSILLFVCSVTSQSTATWSCRDVVLCIENEIILSSRKYVHTCILLYGKKTGMHISLVLSKTIMKTCPCNVYPLKPHFYIVKLGFAGVYLFFLFLLQNIDCGYSLEPPRRGGSNVYPQSMF